MGEGELDLSKRIEGFSPSAWFMDVFTKRGRSVLSVSVLAFICLVLPLLGVKIAGQALNGYLRFPPVAYPMNYPTVHKGALIGIIALILLMCLFWFMGFQRERQVEMEHSLHAQYAFPWWGCFGLGSGIVFWILAWSRFKWFSLFQPYTFILQWLSFIVVVNALTQMRSGNCPMLGNPSFFLRLFIASAALWWVFEYLNRYVNNWIYEGASYSRDPLEYIVFATIAFSTVIPGVYSTRRFLDTFSGLQRFFARGPAVRFATARPLYMFLLLAVSASFLFMGWCPEILYPILWIGPFLGWIALSRAIGIPLEFGGISKGNWSYLLGWAFAALICGFFWEMWNYHSLSKWTYQIPYLQGYQVFEMPIAGYSGYLAFGLECAMAVDIMRRISEGIRSRNA
jgi:hypothetical protein